MKKILLILVTIGVILAILYSLFALFGRESGDTDNPPVGITPPPFSGTATSTGNRPQGNNPIVFVRTVSGGRTPVRDFRKDQFVDAIADNNYILRDTDSPSTATFEILYSDNDGGVIVSLREEPLRATRIIAEEAFLRHMGITREKLCGLSISVAVARDVNEFYAGRELGISSCPGSVALPE